MTTTIATKKPARSVSIFCATEVHSYCILNSDDYRFGDSKPCKCGCHFETRILGAEDISDFAHRLWEISSTVRAHSTTDAEFRAHFELIVNAAEEAVDLSGLTKEQFLDRLLPTFANGYWSRQEVMEALGL